MDNAGNKSNWTKIIKDGIPARYVMVILAFFGFVFNYMLRININITIVSMVNYSAIERSNVSGRGVDCGFNATEDNPDEDGEYAWDETTQSLITGSFFWGYIITQFPGGRLAEVFGGKWLFGLSILLTGFMNILFPLAAGDNPVYLIILRVLMGLFEGSTFPAMHAMLARWSPPQERSRISSIVYAGSQAGTVLGLPLAGLIIDQVGWRAVFYIMGGSSVIWFLLWTYFVFDSPSVHPRISQAELKYLEESLGNVQEKKRDIPWKALLTSKPFWAILIADIGNNWGFWMLLTELPIYLKNIMNYDLKSNAFLSAMPYLFMWLFSIGFGIVADAIMKRKLMSTKNVRKAATLIAHMTGAVCLVCVTFTGCNDVATIVLLTLAVAFQGAIYTGFLTNHIDICPNFAGTLFGITNTAAAVPSWVGPLTASALTQGEQTLANWRKVFLISAAFYAGGSLFFAFFAGGELEYWNGHLKDEAEETEAQTKANAKGNDIKKASTTSILQSQKSD